MRVLGLDLGEKNIGVAVSDQFGWTAQGLESIRSKGNVTADLDQINLVAQQYEVDKVVVGLPRNMNGSYGPQAEKALKFAGLLEKRLGLPVETWDERLSTVAAQRVLLEADVSRKKRRRVVDQMAAAIILQGYLDAKGRNNS
ncbi:MAG: Holliday junction resolvase RuvX [Firmicutes bacterium]|nr:Holliday junction resolvase RuvX [Bacillota bacterium]